MGMDEARVWELETLEEPFLSAIVWLCHRLKEKEIPVLLWETGRSKKRQTYLHSQGFSKTVPGTDPHEYGYAADFILDSSRCETARCVWEGGTQSRWTSFAWDCASPKAVRAWKRFGKEVQMCSLIWGGSWSPFSVDGVGWNYSHVEMPRWRKFTETGLEQTRSEKND
jgi:hypothetical protein